MTMFRAMSLVPPRHSSSLVGISQGFVDSSLEITARATFLKFIFRAVPSSVVLFAAPCQWIPLILVICLRLCSNPIVVHHKSDHMQMQMYSNFIFFLLVSLFRNEILLSGASKKLYLTGRHVLVLDSNVNFSGSRVFACEWWHPKQHNLLCQPRHVESKVSCEQL